MDSLSLQIRRNAETVVRQSRDQGSKAADLLASVLRQYLPSSYNINPGAVLAPDGSESPKFDLLIHTATEGLERVPADNVACAIEVHQSIGRAELRVSYEKIAKVKAISKSPRLKDPKSGITPADAIMGVVVAVDSVEPLERLALELQNLNKAQSHHHWIDLVVVLARGTVNFMCQFPHGKGGDLLPSARSAAMLAPMYVQIFARPHAVFALNRMLALLLTYLYFFSPDGTPPNTNELLRDAPATGLTIAPCQFNLKGDLVPVPPELQFNSLFIFPLGFRAEDRQRNVLSRVQYLPWQDGGVVRVSGKLPIEAFLVFAGKDAISQPVIRLPDAQFSSVIPLSKEQFIQMAERTARQSNLVIRPDKRPSLVMEEIANEGTESPFIARLYLGICNLRDQALRVQADQEKFYKTFDGLMSAVGSMRKESAELIEEFTSHRRKIEQGEGVTVGNGVIRVTGSIQGELRKTFETIVGTASRICKDRMQELLRPLGVDIGFLFRQQKAFDKEIAALKALQPALADYLYETRARWSERLAIRRNLIEHQGWPLPKV